MTSSTFQKTLDFSQGERRKKLQSLKRIKRNGESLLLISIIILGIGSLLIPRAYSISLSLIAVEDAWIDQKNPNDNHGSDKELRVETKTAENRRVLIKFDVSGIPPGSTISSAVLNLFLEDAPSQNRVHAVHKVTAAWTESGVTWNKRDGVNNWGAAGGDFDPTAVGTKQTGIADKVTIQFTITSVVAEWVSGSAANNGLLVKDTQDIGSGDQKAEYLSREEPEVTRKPSLEVTVVVSVTQTATQTMTVTSPTSTTITTTMISTVTSPATLTLSQTTTQTATVPTTITIVQGGTTTTVLTTVASPIISTVTSVVAGSTTIILTTLTSTFATTFTTITVGTTIITAAQLGQAVISGVLRDNNSQPVQGVVVRCNSQTAITDANGNWSMLVPLGSSLICIASKLGFVFSPTSVPIQVTGNMPVTFTAYNARSVPHGTVTTDKGKPFQGVTVKCNGLTAITDANGNWIIILTSQQVVCSAFKHPTIFQPQSQAFIGEPINFKAIAEIPIVPTSIEEVIAGLAIGLSLILFKRWRSKR